MSKSKGKGSSDNVMVMVRVRPFNKREEQEGATEIIEMDKTLCTVTLHKPVEKGAGSATSECLPSKRYLPTTPSIQATPHRLRSLMNLFVR